MVSKSVDCFHKIESGRTMLEMLGVLAIAGVLSIVGILSFRVAMEKHKVNTIIDEAQKRATLVTSQMLLDDNAIPTLNDFSGNDLGYCVFDTVVYTKDNLSAMPNKQYN